MDGNRGFFETAVASAFPTVTDKALLAEFKQANDAVIAAMADYKKWLQDDLLKRSNGNFAIGEETYRRKLAADEMIELPLDELLADRRARFAEEPGGVRRNGSHDRSEAGALRRAQDARGRSSSGGEAAVDDASRARCARHGS